MREEQCKLEMKNEIPQSFTLIEHRNSKINNKIFLYLIFFSVSLLGLFKI